MPMLPVLRVGLMPILQMVILPPIIFFIVEKWWASKKEASSLDHVGRDGMIP